MHHALIYGVKSHAVTSLLDEGAWSSPTLVSFTSGANIPDSSNKAGQKVVLQQRTTFELHPAFGQHI